MKKLEYQDEVVMLKSMLFASLISADNDEYTEEVKQEVLRRHKELSEGKDILSANLDWKYILEPIGEKADKYRRVMEAE